VGGRSRWRWAIERAQGPAANQTVDFVATKWQKKRFFSKKSRAQQHVAKKNKH